MNNDSRRASRGNLTTRIVARSVSLIVAAVLVTLPIAPPAHAAAADTVEIYGFNRIDTALKVSQAAYPTGTPTGGVIIATATNWPDALGGAALAGALEAPILLVGDSLSPALVTEIKRLQGNGAAVGYLLGGEAVVASSVERQLEALFGGPSGVTRLSGANRYATSYRIAEEVRAVAPDTHLDGTVLVATGADYPDALSASALAAALRQPILLGQFDATGAPSTEMRSALTSLGAKRAIVLGGDAAVSRDSQAHLEAVLPAGAIRLDGADRYETSVAIATYGARQAGLTWDGAVIASGDRFPDGLAGSALCSGSHAVMILTSSSYLPTDVRQTLISNAGQIGSVRIVGGTIAIQEPVREAIRNALK